MLPREGHMSPPLPDDDREVNELLARLSSAMSIDSAAAEPAPSTSGDLGGGASLLDCNLSILSDESRRGRKTSSQFSSTTNLGDDDAENKETSTLRLESPTHSHGASTSHDVTSIDLDSTYGQIDSGQVTKRMDSVSIHADAASIAPNEQEIPPHLAKKKKGKKMSKAEMEKMQKEIDMWNASDSTVLEASSQFSPTTSCQDLAEIETMTIISSTSSNRAPTSRDVTSISPDSISVQNNRCFKQKIVKKNSRRKQPPGAPKRRDAAAAELATSSKEKKPFNWNKKAKPIIMSKPEMEKIKYDMNMWNASDATVLEHLLSNKGSVSKWQAVAAARGLCSLSNNCRCRDCRGSYVTFDNDGDAGMGHMIAAPACTLQ